MFIGFLIGLLFVWNIALTYILWKQSRRYNRLDRHGKQGEIKDLLESIIDSQETLSKKTEDIEQKSDELRINGQQHIQYIGMTRFNPFADTGGAQSFSLALLDHKRNGLVMTSLYGRNSNRWYVKEIRGGKGKDFELSREEQEAIKKAYV